ncbi:MAG: sugar phosphate isomerase/epimerase [Lachnospiraceae bacterium]|nr:sugar phosphate isomerase/epimerase [Lachnospiraceae bacterium]
METYERLSGFADEISDNLEEQIRGLRSLGMHYVEMRGADGNNLIYHSDDKVKEIKNRLQDAGIALSAMGSPLGKIGIDEPFEKHFEDFKRAVEIAHMMEVRNIRMFSFYVPDDRREDEATKEEVFRRLRCFAEYAAAEDAVLLHENEKGIYGEKAPACREILDEFGGEHFKAVFDFANFVQAGQDTIEAYELLKDSIAYIHVKDAILGTGKVVPAGYGDGNLEEILRRLMERGYDGFFSLEPHLFEFTGFAGLEKGTFGTKFEEERKLTGFEAFSLAHESFMKILSKF